MEDLTAMSAEAMELAEMDRIFPSLLKKGYLTDSEFQKIILLEQVDDRRLEIYNLLMVKDKSTADEIYNIFREMTSRVSAKENNRHHALLSAVVSDHIFACLPMKDILNCRQVCQQWKTASSNTLQKRVTIHFEKGLGPSKFLKVFKYSLADIRFQCFEFGNNSENGWDVLEIQKLFDKCSPNIKRLDFGPGCFFKKNEDNWFKSYDITHWIAQACNLTKLNVFSSSSTKTEIKIQLSKISKVKFISLKGCVISVDDALKENIQIQPVEITLNDVTFQSEGLNLKKFRLTDVIDFSQATKINFHFPFSTDETKFELNMMGQTLNANRLHGENLKLTLSGAAGKVDFLHLRGCNFVGRNRLQINKLFCENSTLDLSALPKTTKKILFSQSMNYICSEEIDLPRLRYLRLDNDDDFPLIALFNRCSNLVEIHLCGGCWLHDTGNLNVHLIPKSVKRISLATNIVITNPNADDNVGQGIRGKNFILNLDTLILQDYLHRMSFEVSEMMSVIKPKVLVVSCDDDTWEEKVIDTSSICDFLLANKQLHKLIIGCTVHDLHEMTPFELSAFARFVGRKKSDYYEFENIHETANGIEDPVGTPISKQQFYLYTQMNGL